MKTKMKKTDWGLKKARNILYDILKNDLRLLGFELKGIIRISKEWERGTFLIKIYLKIRGIAKKKVIGYWLTLEELENFEKEKEDWALKIYFDIEKEIRQTRGRK